MTDERRRAAAMRVFDVVDDGLLVVAVDPDAGFPVVDANAAAARMSGLALDEVIGSTLAELQPPRVVAGGAIAFDPPIPAEQRAQQVKAAIAQSVPPSSEQRMRATFDRETFTPSSVCPRLRLGKLLLADPSKDTHVALVLVNDHFSTRESPWMPWIVTCLHCFSLAHTCRREREPLPARRDLGPG